jgi:GWxTD domain-containing protein
MRKYLKCQAAVLILILCLVPGLSAKKDKYKVWLNEEVYWLITPEEEDAFKKLKTDKDKDEFIALFWAKRDPTPFTEKNEFREAYYTNLEFVNTKYTRGQEMGWKTIIGKALLFFGLPRERSTNPETWVYDPIPHLKIDSEFAIVWDAVEGVGLVLNQNMTDKAALDAMDEYAYRSTLHPNLTEVPDYKKFARPDSRNVERNLLEEASAEESSHMDIPFEPSFYFSKAENGASSMTLVYFLDPRESDLEKAVLFGRFRKEEEQPKDFRQEIKLKKDDYYGKVVLPILPGNYSIILGLKDAQSERYSALKREIHVPDFWNGELALGSFILTGTIEDIKPGSKDFSAFNFGQFFAHPKRNPVFKKSDTLNVLYQIYNAGTENGQVKLSQEISLKSEARTYKLPEQPLEREVPVGQVLISGFPIPLAQIDAGEYELLVKITDKISGRITEAANKVVIQD